MARVRVSPIRTMPLTSGANGPLPAGNGFVSLEKTDNVGELLFCAGK